MHTSIPLASGTLHRRLILAAAILLSASMNARAQAGMPDLSKAPADIQAIWKNTLSGHPPTPAEAQKLAVWLEANKENLKKGAMATADTVKRAYANMPKLGATDPGASCPSKSPALERLSTTSPTPAAAAALLDSLRVTYAAQGKPTGLTLLDSWAGQRPLADVSAGAAAFYLAGYDAPSIITYVTAAKRASGLERQRKWGDLGAALAAINDGANAVPVLRFALSLGTRNAWLVHNLGVAYADLGDLAHADTLLREATRLEPAFGGAWDALARVQSCEGNMTAAWHSVAKAQETDWSDERQQKIDKHDEDTNTNQSDDEIAASPMPAPPFKGGGGRPPLYSAPTPSLGDSRKETHDKLASFIATANAYANEKLVIGAEKPPRQDAETQREMDREVERLASDGMAIIVTKTNAHEAERGAARVDRINTARIGIAFRDFNEMADRQRAVIMNRLGDVHKSAKTTEQLCHGVIPIAQEDYLQRKAIVSNFIGKLSAIAEKYNASMGAWFAFADDPEARHSIDALRRIGLAHAANMQFVAAMDYNPILYPNCEDGSDGGPGTSSAKSSSKEDTGKCEAKKAKVPSFEIESDCHRFVLAVQFGKLPELKLDYQRASGGRNGSVFVGVGASVPLGLASGQAGLKVTFDQGGWVQSFGPAAAGSAGIEALTGTVSEEGMIDVLHGGSASGSFSASGGTPGSTSTVSFGVAGSPHFSGKM